MRPFLRVNQSHQSFQQKDKVRNQAEKNVQQAGSEETIYRRAVASDEGNDSMKIHEKLNKIRREGSNASRHRSIENDSNERFNVDRFRPEMHKSYPPFSSSDEYLHPVMS